MACEYDKWFQCCRSMVSEVDGLSNIPKSVTNVSMLGALPVDSRYLPDGCTVANFKNYFQSNFISLQIIACTFVYQIITVARLVKCWIW